MEINELKLELIAKIIDTNDFKFLLKISTLLEVQNYTQLKKNISSVHEPALKYESVRVFSAEEQRKINLALEQYKNGECISDEEAQKEIQEWLED
jgi:lipase chaperone LimK